MCEPGSLIVGVKGNWGCGTSFIPDYAPQADECFDVANLGKKAPVPARLARETVRDLVQGQVDVMFPRELAEEWKCFLVSEIRVLFGGHRVDMRNEKQVEAKRNGSRC